MELLNIEYLYYCLVFHNGSTFENNFEGTYVRKNFLCFTCTCFAIIFFMTHSKYL